MNWWVWISMSVILFWICYILLRFRILGELHIESSPLGSRFDFILPTAAAVKIGKRKYILVKIVRTEASEEEHEKYILKEKE